MYNIAQNTEIHFEYLLHAYLQSHINLEYLLLYCFRDKGRIILHV